MSPTSTKNRKISTRMSMYLKVLHRHGGMSGAEIAKRYPQFCRRSIYRHLQGEVDSVDRRNQNPGRPRKLTVRDERNLLRAVRSIRKKNPSFTVKQLQEETNLLHVSSRLIRLYLNKHGYRYLQARKKGLLTEADKKKRILFAKKWVDASVDFWKDEIAFYFDGVGFAHKSNPYAEATCAGTMAWRQRGEGLKLSTKGKKEGSGGQMANFFVAISHSKGTVLCKQYTEKLTGKSFAEFVLDQFPQTYQRAMKPTKKFLQDGDPRQNSKAAQNSMASINCEMFSIPPRSPDFNPVENIFHLVRKQLHRDAREQEIKQETYKDFSNRVKSTIENFPVDIIDKTIESLPKRLIHAIESKGERTKY